MSGAEAPRKNSLISRIALVVGAVIGLLGVLVLLNWQRVAFGLAVLFAEQRPDLLKDAHWDDPASAKAFNARFPAGSLTSALEDWLAENKFEIDASGQRADTLIEGFPCMEIIEVTWASTPEGKLREAKVTIPPGSCL